MRILIDGYNVMHAAGLMGVRFGRDGLRKARTRFLNDLATRIGPVDSHLTTVVFDANRVPEGLPSVGVHRGIGLVFAVENPTADERIEELIRGHSDPKRLMVVSSDNQVRASARRRGATPVGADEFLTRIEEPARPRVEDRAPSPPEKPEAISPAEAAYWARQFDTPEIRAETTAAFRPDPMFPTEDEIARIEAEVDREDQPGVRRRV